MLNNKLEIGTVLAESIMIWEISFTNANIYNIAWCKSRDSINLEDYIQNEWSIILAEMNVLRNEDYEVNN